MQGGHCMSCLVRVVGVVEMEEYLNACERMRYRQKKGDIIKGRFSFQGLLASARPSRMTSGRT